jgi:hypothetical protein
MSLEAAVTLSVTIIVAGIGYLVTYLNNLAVERRKARLDRVNRQLQRSLRPPLRSLRGDVHGLDGVSRPAPQSGHEVLTLHR